MSAAGPGGDQDSEIRLTLPATAENVVLVRHVVASLADTMGLPRRLVEDLKLAVTEACTNVVRHAYGGREGVLELEVQREERQLVVVVEDHGCGMRPRPDSGGAGLGLPLIAALAAGLEIEHGEVDGTRVRMSFGWEG